MKIHEYQAKELFNENGIAVPAGIAATSVEEAVQAAESLKESGSTLFVVKAQIHAGGRGKGLGHSAASLSSALGRLD